MIFDLTWQEIGRLLSRLFRFVPIEQPKISVLIPFQTKDPKRQETFRWLLRYWKAALPDAEFIIGRNRDKPFSKTRALNDAAERAMGKVLVILDADAYMSAKVIDRVADMILENPDDHLWFVPYRRLYRLNELATDLILDSDPNNPLTFSDPPPPEFRDGVNEDSKYGHRYGAMVMVFPREALDAIGGFDARFIGWGGEDIAILRAMDTLYGKHKTVNTAIFHLWHPFIGSNKRNRRWSGQKMDNPNDQLANAYNKATRNPSAMQDLVDKAQESKRKKR